MRVVAKKVQMIRLQEKQNKCVKNTETNCAKQYKSKKKNGMKNANKPYNYLIKEQNIQLLQKSRLQCEPFV